VSGSGHISGIETLPSDKLISSHHNHAFIALESEVPSQAVPEDVRSPLEEIADSAIEKLSLDLESRPSFTEISPSSSTDNIPETRYAFQDDLQLDLPITVFQKYSTRKPHNYNLGGSKSYAYATFLATRNPSLKDPYFLAIHSLIYRILWSSRTRSQSYPLIVFVAEHVSDEQRALLAGAGALVRELAPLQWECNVSGVQDRWKDLFAKLNMWKETDFERVLFLDADAFPLANIDNMFDLAPTQECIPEKLHLDDFLSDGPVCEPYVFAGVPQDPFHATHPNINVGSMVFAPSLRMHARLLQNYVKTNTYDCRMAEQAFLNWQFGPNSAYPGTRLERPWGGFFPTEEEGDGKLKVVHEKLWAIEKGWMKEEWEMGWKDMMEFYNSEDFARAREDDGVVTVGK
jgi:alpha-N-acetylglucosamine transferase